MLEDGTSHYLKAKLAPETDSGGPKLKSKNQRLIRYLITQVAPYAHTQRGSAKMNALEATTYDARCIARPTRGTGLCTAHTATARN